MRRVAVDVANLAVAQMHADAAAARAHVARGGAGGVVAHAIATAGMRRVCRCCKRCRAWVLPGHWASRIKPRCRGRLGRALPGPCYPRHDSAAPSSRAMNDAVQASPSRASRGSAGISRSMLRLLASMGDRTSIPFRIVFADGSEFRPATRRPRSRFGFGRAARNAGSPHSVTSPCSNPISTAMSTSMATSPSRCAPHATPDSTTMPTR